MSPLSEVNISIQYSEQDRQVKQEAKLAGLFVLNALLDYGKNTNAELYREVSSIQKVGDQHLKFALLKQLIDNEDKYFLVKVVENRVNQLSPNLILDAQQFKVSLNDSSLANKLGPYELSKLKSYHLSEITYLFISQRAYTHITNLSSRSRSHKHKIRTEQDALLPTKNVYYYTMQDVSVQRSFWRYLNCCFPCFKTEEKNF